MVKSTDIDHPEQGMDLTTREIRGARHVEADLQRVKHGTPTAEDELKALRERIASVKGTPPKDDAPHCADCFERGLRAALRAIDG